MRIASSGLRRWSALSASSAIANFQCRVAIGGHPRNRTLVQNPHMPSRVPTFQFMALWPYAFAGALILFAIAAVAVWLGLPPRVVVMTTGAPGSDYESLAVRYQEVLKRSGVELRLLPSGGGAENLQRLDDAKSRVAVGFAEGGLTNEVRSPRLTSLGTMFFQPLWIFSRASPESNLASFRGKKVSIGQEGSGTRALVVHLMTMNGVGEGFADLRPLSAVQAREALLRGEIDAAAMLASWDSPVVRQLLASSDVNLIGAARADAYVALLPYLSKLRLPAGVGNMATNRPPTDVEVIAAKTSLIVRRDLHPAIQYLLLEAATEIHSAPDIFQQFGRFPAAERGDLPLSANAQQFYKSGPPLLQRYLPFWLAVLVSRLLLVLIPVVALAYPVVTLAPALYLWVARRRILQLYGDLKLIEADLETSGGIATEELLVRIKRWEERAHRLRVPVDFVPTVYSLLTHVAIVRDRKASNEPARRGV